VGRRLTPEKKKQKSGRQGSTWPWMTVFLAALPMVVSVYYLAWVAPALVPVSAGVSVPFPAATRFLETVCAWSGDHRLGVVLIGLGLLASGILFRFSLTAQRYYIVLTVTVSLALGFTYLSISAPIDRLINAVEAAIPGDHRVPNPAAGGER